MRVCLSQDLARSLLVLVVPDVANCSLACPGGHPCLAPPHHSCSYCFPSGISGDGVPRPNRQMEGFPFLLKQSRDLAIPGIVFLSGLAV